MTKSEKKILAALGWGNPAVRSDILRKQVGLSVRGFAMVIGRMQAQNLLFVTRGNGWFLELTLRGHKLKERGAL